MSEERRSSPLFAATLVGLAIIAAIGAYYAYRTPSVSVENTVNGFLQAARAQQFEDARKFCTPDLAAHAIRAWMAGGFEYQLNEVDNVSQSTANIEAEITKGKQHFILNFGLYNGDNRWLINMMMVTR